MQTTNAVPCHIMPVRKRTVNGSLPKTHSFRKILLISLFLVPFISAKAGTKTAIANAGAGWNVDANWSPFGKPQDGDSVIIPVGFIIKIKLDIYGITAPNLFIKVFGTLDFDPSGKLDLGSGSSVSLLAGGKIVSHGSSSELVKIGGVIKYNGNIDGTLNGPAYASSSTGTSPLGFSPGVLAIHLYSFQARLLNYSVKLDWTASSDNPNDRFYVQRSNDGLHWDDIHVISVMSNMNEVASYQYTDHLALKGTSFYRILLSNADGNLSYSRTIPIVTDIQHIKLFPNPANSEARITWKQRSASQPVFVRVSDITNTTILMQMVKPGDQFFSFDTRTLPAGIYRIQVTDKISFSESSSLVVSR